MCANGAEDNLHSMYNLKFLDKGRKRTLGLMVKNYRGHDEKGVYNEMGEVNGAWD